MQSPSSFTKRRGSGSALGVSCSPPEDSRVWRLSVFILDRTHPSNPRRNRMTVNRASARYEGFGKEGKGSITTKSGVPDKKDRKSVGKGRGVSLRLRLGGGRIIK